MSRALLDQLMDEMKNELFDKLVDKMRMEMRAQMEDNKYLDDLKATMLFLKDGGHDQEGGSDATGIPLCCGRAIVRLEA